MFACPSCAAPVASARSCPACGSGIDIADSPTGTAPRACGPTPSPTPSRTRSAPRRTRGAAGRRAVRAGDGPRRPLPDRRPSRPGRDGRGLPRGRPEARTAGRPEVPSPRPRADEDRLARFYREVRVARQVSHPAVCRVYDVGEAEGHISSRWSSSTGRTSPRSCGASGDCPRTRPSTSPASSAPVSPPRTRRGSCTATSSPPTSCSTARATSASPTSASPASPGRSAKRTSVPARPPTCRRSSSKAGGHGPERHLRASAWCSTSSSPAAGPSRERSPSRRGSTATSGRSSPRPSWPGSIPRSSGRSSPASRRSRGAVRRPRSSSPRCSPGAILSRRRSRPGRPRRRSSWPRPARRGPAAGRRLGPSRLRAGRPRRSCPSWPARSSSPAAPGRKAAGRPRGPRAGVPARAWRRGPPVDDAWGLARRLGLHRPGPREGLVARAVGGARRGPRRCSSSGTGRARGRSSPCCPAGSVYWRSPGLDVTDMAGVIYDTERPPAPLLRHPAPARGRRPAPARAPDWSRLSPRRGSTPAFRGRPRWTPLFHTDTRAAWEGTWPERQDLPIRIEAAAYRGGRCGSR